MHTPAMATFREYLQGLQTEICDALSAIDGTEFGHDHWQRAEGGGGNTRVLNQGQVFEQAGVGLSVVSGNTLPPAASAARPQLAGAPWQAMGVSLVIHPRNPYIPTSHMNVRMFVATPPDAEPVWWFGGGFDLTPYYGFVEDCQHWHRTAQQTCQSFSDDLYARLKSACDRYFFLKHRNEARGIGGIFFDDFTELGAEGSQQFTQAVGRAFLQAYLPIVERRKDTPYGEREREFQLYRRGRYVEFNLVCDRGTIFGLQSGGRTDSILMSLPPEVRWGYAYQSSADSAEAVLTQRFLPAQDWLAE